MGVRFEVGDKVVATGNYRDEQLGEFAPRSVQVITETMPVKMVGASGQWVKTDLEDSWVDAGWFALSERDEQGNLRDRYLNPQAWIDRIDADNRALIGENKRLSDSLGVAIDILAALAGYGVALPDEAYDLIEMYHGRL